MAEYEYIGDGRPDGTIIGRTSTEKVGFFGTAPIDQEAANTAVTTSVTTTATTTQLASTVADLVTLVNAINTNLSNYGLTA